MEFLLQFYQASLRLLPVGITAIAVVLLLWGLDRFLRQRYAGTDGLQFRRQMTMLAVTLAGVLAVVVSLPVSDSLRGQLLSLIGILVSATIALSSTTFIGNMMAGIMLRAVGNFRPGDFLSIGEHFGRVSEMGLLHTELQTEHRDLTTLPNLYLVTNPTKVVRSTGTIVWAEVSLGYDVPHQNVEEHLRAAAEAVPLKEPFVHIRELGDFSILYRVGGLLEEVKQILSARARLRMQMLDTLHAAGIEIVSPGFMNTRALAEQQRMIPQVVRAPARAEDGRHEDVVFDKAEAAESIEKIREQHARLGEDIAALKEQITQADPAGKGALEARLAQAERRAARLLQLMEQAEPSEN